MHLHTKGSPTTSRAASSCSSRSLGDRSTASPQRSGKELLPRAATGKAASYAAMFASGGAACLASERAQHHQSAPRSTAYTSTVAFAASAPLAKWSAPPLLPSASSWPSAAPGGGEPLAAAGEGTGAQRGVGWLRVACRTSAAAKAKATVEVYAVLRGALWWG